MIIRAIATVSAVAIATPALAQNTDNDVRCLLLSSAFSRMEKDPGRKQVAEVAAIYYFGRVDTRLSGVPLKNQILAQGKSLNGVNAGQQMTACAKQMQVRRQAFQALGQSIVKQAVPGINKPPAKK
jgi:hypothetical protein